MGHRFGTLEPIFRTYCLFDYSTRCDDRHKYLGFKVVPMSLAVKMRTPYSEVQSQMVCNTYNTEEILNMRP